MWTLLLVVVLLSGISPASNWLSFLTFVVERLPINSSTISSLYSSSKSALYLSLSNQVNP